VLDDTIAWILVAVVAGVTAQHAFHVSSLAVAVVGVAAFLVFSLTIGRSIVAFLIKWTNDNFTVEAPVITAILVVMLAMALTTDLVGVHTALGAFVSGILIGRSPILTEHIKAELKGFILAFFSPVFFAVAGLGADLTTLNSWALIGLTGVVVLIASIGKFMGALAGGRIGGLSTPEALTLAVGLNARGSTEVIVATIGLSMGALSETLYTMIVAMAVITTMLMPPALRWAAARAPMRPEEAERLAREEAEEKQFLPKMERALVFADASRNGELAAHLAGAFAGARNILSTVVESDSEPQAPDGATRAAELTKTAADAVVEKPDSNGNGKKAAKTPAAKLVEARTVNDADEMQKELAKGYDIVFAGREHPLGESAGRFAPDLRKLVDGFDGPCAIVLNGEHAAWDGRPLRIFTPSDGAAHAKLATEIALTLARATKGRLTVMHVFSPQEDVHALRREARRRGLSVLAEARSLGRHNETPVEALTTRHARPEIAIARAAAARRYDLVVVGAEFRIARRKFLGPRTEALLQSIKAPILLVAI
jgi:nucleotide-binding universal stress UspA family protein